jgi:hypothetical protein
MSKVDLNKWARVSEIAAAIAVVISLAYIAIELDQSNRATQTTSWQAVDEMLAGLDTAEATELGVFIQRAEMNPDEVSADEYWRFSRMAQARLGIIEFAYLSMKTGTLGEYHWDAMAGYLRHTMCKPGYRRVWAEIGASVYHPDFQELISEIFTGCGARTGR